MKKKTVNKKLKDILAAEKYVEAQAIEATILFADLIDSTHFKAVKGAAEGLKRTLLHNQTITKIVIQNKGEVIKYIGDEIMALFESPDNALEAALQVNQTWKKTPADPPIETKIGIHKGSIRFFIYPRSETPDPQGTTVDLAARIVSCAKGRQILFSDEVRSSVQKKWKIADTKDFIPKGIASKVTIHSLKFANCVSQIERPEFVSSLDKFSTAVLEQAKNEFTKRNFKTAMELAEQVLKVEKENPGANYIIGAAVASKYSDKVDKGISCLEKTIYHSPKHQWALRLLGFLLWLKNEKNPDKSLIERAVALTRESIKVSQSPDVDDRYNERLSLGNLAYYLAQLGGQKNISEAIKLCKTVDESYKKIAISDYSDFLDTYGFVLMKNGNYKESRKKLEESRELNPDNEYAFLHIAELLRKMKEPS